MRRSNITCFENLPNEIFYEISQYFDSYDIYQIFSNLNYRFYSLVNSSSLPITLNFSHLSKTTLQHRCNTILIPNIHRIKSLQFFHHILIDQFFSSFSLGASLTRLNTLSLYNTKCDNLCSILTIITVLPSLHSLTITSIEKVQVPRSIYSSIVRLPVLKYCKLSIGLWSRHIHLPLDEDEFSPIEHFIIDSKFNLDQLNDLLSHMPYLKRLSCEISISDSTQMNMSIVSVNLTSLSIKLEDTSFDEFEWFISYCSEKLQYLCISTQRDNEFLNANRWEKFITNQMPNLSKFYFRHKIILGDNIYDCERYHALFEHFKTSFWMKRKWFFTHQHYKSEDYRSCITFYSIQPYRWNQYDFYEDSCQINETGVNLARQVDLHNYSSNTLNSIQFPRINRLTLSGKNIIGSPSFISKLTDKFSPIKLTELFLMDNSLRLEQLLLLLNLFPNIQVLTIPTSILYLNSPQTDKNRLMMNKNHLSKINLLNQCNLADLQILHRFCPYVNSLEIETDDECLEMILHFLLRMNTNQNQRNRSSIPLYGKGMIYWQQEHSICSHCMKNQNLLKKKFPCNHRLSLICFREVNYSTIQRVQRKIEQDTFIEDYVLEYLDQNMYVWW